MIVVKNLTKNKQLENTEAPLIEDIRLLGKVLGDIVREQEGDSVYLLVG